MKNLTITLLTILPVAVFLVSPVRGQMATEEEALTVAENWIFRVMENKGYWGGSDWAQIADIRQFRRGQRVIGYFCDVAPAGFIIVSLRKELAPIKAYSEDSNLDPESDEGMTDLLKTKMEGILDAIEEPIRLFGVSAGPRVKDLIEIDYKPAWEGLSGKFSTLQESLQSENAPANYQQGRVLLSSNWHQGDPYNKSCPIGDTTCIEGVERTVVGCVATAAAQIMNYWKWPPRGVGSHAYDWDGDNSCEPDGTLGAKRLSVTFSDNYDWLNMPDTLTKDSPQSQIDAVAELCYEIGVAVEMDYGVKGSGVNSRHLYLVSDSYKNNFRYSSEPGWAERYVPDRNPSYYSSDAWFNVIKEQLNANRPLQYFIFEHSIVLDGWQDDPSGRKYHMNYGWAGGIPNPDSEAYHPDWDKYTNSNAWYTLDALPGSNPVDEYMYGNIYPAQALGARLDDNRTYNKQSFNYRYFDQDTTGINVTFSNGQNLQFLPGVKVTCEGGNIRFEGVSNDNTRLFSIKGMNQAVIKISNGGLKLHAGGGIRFY